MNRIIIYFLVVVIRAISAFLFNVLLIERLIITDICYYHSHLTTFIFDIFYSFPSSEGGHPTTSNFSIILSLVIGGYSTFYFTKREMAKY